MAKGKEKAVTVRGGFVSTGKVKKGKEKAVMPLKGKSKLFKSEKAVKIS